MIWADVVNEYWWENRQKYCAVDLYSDDVPTFFPTSGSEVEKLDDNLVIGKESTLYVINTAQMFMMNSQGEWKEQ